MITESEKEWMRARIEKAIDKIVSDAGEAGVFPETYVGADTVAFMARAAMAVYLAVAEAQVYLVENGYLNKRKN